MTAHERPSRRTPITLLVLAFAAVIVLPVVLSSRKPSSQPAPADAGAGTAATTPTGPASGAHDGADAGTPPATEGGAAPAGATGIGAAETASIAAWRAVAPSGTFAERGVPAPLGSLDPRNDRLQVLFAPRAAGFATIQFSDYWETAAAKRAADAHWSAVRDGAAAPPPLPPEELRYVLQNAVPMALGASTIEVPQLAVHSLEIDGTIVSLFGDVWSADGPGAFVSEVRDGDGRTMLRVRRTVAIQGEGYDLAIGQRVENLSGRPLAVRWIQYGPTDLRLERSRYIDARRFHFGYLLPPGRDPAQRTIIAGTDQMIDRTAVLKAVAARNFSLWPNQASTSEQLVLGWFGATNRYFGFAVHAPDPLTGPLPLAGSVELVRAVDAFGPDGDQVVLTELHSPSRTIAPGAVGAFDLSFFVGPLQRSLLTEQEPYRTLGLSGLIVYLISGCCSFCTFAWLATLLLTFLSFLHNYVVFDWGLAIIALVVVVRSILHPITRRAQISLQKSTKAMGELRPEMEKLQQRFKDDPKRIQEETMRLYREKNINPIGCATGLLPTFLQMPIWIALYAMLYFAFELRQQPAFFGVFQLLGNWPFLADLSAADHFFYEFERPHQVLFLTLSGINLLPILMGVVFYVQQKYLTPPSAVPLSPEQEQQQKIMKFMMVVMFPLMMYTAPSGLTLYWLTSSLIGIFEVQLIRKHIAQADAKASIAGPSGKPAKKKQDLMGRMYEEAMKRAQARQEQKRNPQKKFKER